MWILKNSKDLLDNLKQDLSLMYPPSKPLIFQHNISVVPLLLQTESLSGG
jgi:hypothetical protein